MAELPLPTTWHMTCCTWHALDLLHVICTWLHPGHLSICVGDSLQHSEKIAKKASIAAFNAVIILVIVIRLQKKLELQHLMQSLLLLLLLCSEGYF